MIVLVFLATAGSTFAHNPDTSYARFEVARDRLDTTFTFDVFSLLRIVPQLDADQDHAVTDAELQAQAAAVFAFLRQRVLFEIDGTTADFGEPQPVSFPPDSGGAVAVADFHSAASLVHFSFHKSLPTPPADFWVQFDFFDQLGDRHTVLGAIAHAGQQHEVIFRRFEPDYLFDTGYTPTAPPADGSISDEGKSSSVAPPAPSPADSASPPRTRSTSPRSNTKQSLWRQLASFFRLGIEHIFLGYDHILFLLSLIVVCRLRELVKIVTSFTVAHTITLILAALEVVQLPSRFVETAIAATIVYVAVENFWIRDTSRRWRLTFAFGLIHGFGFAGVLRQLGLPTQGLVRSLVSFNIGVETGQLVIVLILFPLAAAIARWRYGKQTQLVISAVIALCGLGWFLDRAFALGLMPF